MEPEEAAALSALENGDYSGAAMAYRNWLQRKPDEVLAKVGLAQCELMIRIGGLNPDLTIKDANSHPTDIEKQLMAADIEIAKAKLELENKRIDTQAQLDMARMQAQEKQNNQKVQVDLFKRGK